MKKFLSAMVLVVGCAVSASAAPVAGVSFEGLVSVPEKMVREAVGTKVGEELDTAKVQKDIQALFDMGYFSHVGVRGEETEKGAGVVFELEEHPVVKGVVFDGLSLYDGKGLASQLATKPGKMFNQNVFKKDLEAIKEFFDKGGYGIQLRGMKMSDDGVVHVLCHEPMVHEVRSEGNKYVKDYVIRRYIPTKAGKRFDRRVLDYADAALKRSGLFSAVRTVAVPREDGDVDIVAQVVEQKTASITFNLGYGSDEGMSGGISFHEGNVGGNAQSFDVGFNVNEDDESAYWVTWSDPYMSNKRLSWTVGLYRREDDDLTYRYGSGTSRYDVFDYREERTGGFVSISKWFDPQGRWQWRLTADRHDSETEYQDEAVGAFTKAETKQWFDAIAGDGDLDSSVFLLRGEVIRNGMDGRVPYAKGWRASVGIEQAIEVFGGDCDYTKYWAEGVYYLPFKDMRLQKDTDPVTLAARVRAGWSSGYIPLAEQYSLGGSATLRGYESGDFKGHEMLLGNFELRIPILKNFSLVGFYDTGNAWDTTVSSMSLSDLYDNWGVGGRFKTPMGLVRVDVAFGGDETKWNFSIGELF